MGGPLSSAKTFGRVSASPTSSLARVPAPSELAHDSGYSALHAEVKATRAGQHVLKCYREHREAVGSAVGQAARAKAE